MTPGRRAALLIGVPVVLLLIVVNSYSLVSNVGKGSYPVSATVPLADGRLAMSLGGGNVTLRGSQVSSATALVAGEVTYQLKRPSLRFTPGSISLACPWIDTGNCSLNATVDVPAGTAMNVTTGGGDLSATGMTGGGTVSTDGGNLTVTDAAGDLTLTSGGGDVSAGHVSGPDVTISSNGGNIGGTGVTASTVTADSGGGDVTLTLTAVPRNLSVKADGGNVTIVVPPGAYSVSTNADGGNLNHSIENTRGARNVITVSSGGGDISLSES
jgi:hypothetical protein